MAKLISDQAKYLDFEVITETKISLKKMLIYSSFSAMSIFVITIIIPQYLTLNRPFLLGYQYLAVSLKRHITQDLCRLFQYWDWHALTL
ncbi:MAG TPA: hypothetical protein DIS98_11095 [Colwellia sp.]|nr:hypothetical protein [Colwellia sp.]